MQSRQIIFPGNKKFAFSIFDDTDLATTENIKPMYDFLGSLGMKCTKSVWAFPPKKSASRRQDTLSDRHYLAFIKDLQEDGFEIGFHGAKDGSSKRDEVIDAIKIFNRCIGHYPKVYANHLDNLESLYWGLARFNSAFLRIISRYLKNRRSSEGHLEDSAYFWGDIARKHITYTRNFVFSGINTVKHDLYMPYHDPTRSYVNYWFSSSDGFNVSAFNKLLSESNQDILEKERGVCVVYTHFAYGFVENGQINPITKALIKRLSSREGWFVPVGTLLDYLRDERDRSQMSVRARRDLELRWLFNRIQHRRFFGP